MEAAPAPARTRAGWPSSLHRAARAIGVSTDEYARHKALGDAWCASCKLWKHERTGFGRSGLGRRDRYCLECRAK